MNLGPVRVMGRDVDMDNCWMPNLNPSDAGVGPRPNLRSRYSIVMNLRCFLSGTPRPLRSRCGFTPIHHWSGNFTWYSVTTCMTIVIR